MSNRDNARKRHGRHSQSADQRKKESHSSTTNHSGERDAELEDMIQSADLLSIAEGDSDGRTERHGSQVYFRGRCPICGHNDCFRYYGDTNSWACFGGTSDKGAGKTAAGGNVLDYLERRHGGDKSAAVEELRNITGHPREEYGQGARKPAHKVRARTIKTNTRSKDSGDGFPPFETTDLNNVPPLDPELIHGILRERSKMILFADSKAGKTWNVTNLAVAVATGGEWMGNKCEQGKVLYCDFELNPNSFKHRLRKVAKAMGADYDVLAANLTEWHLRGVNPDMASFTDVLVSRIAGKGYALVVLDPLYKICQANENDAHEVGEWCGHVDEICKGAGVACVYVHHHAKGNAGDRAAIDRGSGSGVFARDADAIIDMTEVFPSDGELSEDTPRAFAVTAALRDFPPIAPFHILFHFPVYQPDTDGITADWKPRTSQQRGGRQTAKTRQAQAAQAAAETSSKIAQFFIREGIGAEGITLKQASEICGCDPRTVKSRVEASSIFELHSPSAKRCLVVPSQPPRTEHEQPRLS